jgi:hypothetical protein
LVTKFLIANVHENKDCLASIMRNEQTSRLNAKNADGKAKFDEHKNV